MAEISPAKGNQSLKEGGWEETEPSHVPTEKCTLSVQIDGGAMEVNDSACCQTYAVAAGKSQFESDSPTEHRQQKTHHSSLITGCSTTPPNASLAPAAETPVVSHAVDPSSVLMQMNTAPNDMTPSRSEKQPPSSHPAYISDALTKLANVRSEIDQQQGGAVRANATVVHACSEEVQRQADVHIQLEGVELWQQFHSVDTEMIITRAGRYGSHVLGYNFIT